MTDAWLAVHAETVAAAGQPAPDAGCAWPAAKRAWSVAPAVAPPALVRAGFAPTGRRRAEGGGPRGARHTAAPGADEVLPETAERADGSREPLASWLRVRDRSPV
ncbi:hypothetical protein ACO0M4_29360 [Streptomyces sp. RGM 3693]|uniref:hypothetical protein n=1 Tax=Streptomyces sp. RGM 3693 TaxID=3413284 RepID=UPI003D2658DA